MTTSIRPQHYKPVCRKMGIGASVRKGRELERWQERDINIYGMQDNARIHDNFMSILYTQVDQR